MFTGIVSDVGEILEMKPIGALRRMVVASAYDPASVAVGASIANAGVCLTTVAARGAASVARGSLSTSGPRRWR